MRQPHLRMAAQRHAFSPGWQPCAACPAAGCWPDVPAGQNALLLLPMASICRRSAYASQPALLVNSSLACCCPIARCLWLQRASSWHLASCHRDLLLRCRYAAHASRLYFTLRWRAAVIAVCKCLETTLAILCFSLCSSLQQAVRLVHQCVSLPHRCASAMLRLFDKNIWQYPAL